MLSRVLRIYRNTVRPQYPINRNAPWRERHGQIIQCYRTGETLQAIAAKFHLSFQRVHQVIRHYRPEAKLWPASKLTSQVHPFTAPPISPCI